MSAAFIRDPLWNIHVRCVKDIKERRTRLKGVIADGYCATLRRMSEKEWYVDVEKSDWNENMNTKE